jgi:anti-sigma regulatory factor (Ser/Thr protein kinase)
MIKEFDIQDRKSSTDVMKEILRWAALQIENSPLEKNKQWIPILCFEELVTNIFRYGEMTFPTKLTIKIEVTFEKKVMLLIRDQGLFFDIKKHIVKRHENQIGGGGIPLIKALMQIHQYQKDGYNCTELVLEP